MLPQIISDICENIILMQQTVDYIHRSNKHKKVDAMTAAVQQQSSKTAFT